MGRLVAFLTCVALLSGGCTSYKNSKDVAQLGGGLIGATLLIGIPIADKSENITANEAAGVMVPLILIGLALGTIGVIGMGVHKAAGNDRPDPMIVSEPPPPPRVDPVAQQMAEQERRRRSAWDMTQQARVAAHANDCPRVAYLATRVYELDRATFDTVFSRDPYIIKCAPQPQQPPQPPPRDPPRNIPIPPLNPTIPPPPTTPPVEPPPAEPTP